jgi:cytosine/adenosine deaminase-related metal-dependent hydrolase
MVTLNPAKMLHVEDKVGSIKVGKDADLVLWSDNPLSNYSMSLYTVVDGIIYFDREKDVQLRKTVAIERNRIIKKMNGEKRTGAPVVAAQPTYKIMQTCGDHYHSHGLLTIDSEEQ